MTEWTVVGVIVVLIGLFFTVGKPIMENQKEMNKLRFETDQQGGEIGDNLKALRELTKITQSHENRITNTESEVEKLALSIKEMINGNLVFGERIHDLERDVEQIKNKE